jgi:aromatic-L-amino-acid decarboxylase
MTDVPHMTPDEFRKRGRELIDFIADYLDGGADEFPVLSKAAPGEIGSMLPESAPEQGEAWDEIMRDIDRVVMPGLTHWQSSGFCGYFPANSTYPAILGELLSAGLGVQGMLWQTSPACTEIETRMMDWLGRAIGLPDAFLDAGEGNGGGVIQGTASEAVMVAMLAARSRAGLMHEDPKRLTVYASSQAHSSIAKGARLIGLPEENVRLVSVDEKLRMRPEVLGEMIEQDKVAGLAPIFVCATVGTTSTGAVDSINTIAPITREHGVWLHVDAAWLGCALVCPEHRWTIDGVEDAESFNFNPHKSLLVNFDCSAFWVRDRSALIDAMSITPEYLRNKESDAGAVIDYRDWQIPLGRRFRAMKLWFVLRHYGTDGLRAHISHLESLGKLCESFVQADDRFEITTERSLSLLTFRLKAGKAQTKSLMESINATGEVFLTHTSVPLGAGGEPEYVLRFAAGSVRADEAAVCRVWGEIQRVAGEIA